MDAAILYQTGERSRRVWRCGTMDKKYNFQILLPNGTTVRLKLQNPQMKMSFRDFIERVEKEYVRTWKQSGSLKRKREINWKGGSFLWGGISYILFHIFMCSSF